MCSERPERTRLKPIGCEDDEVSFVDDVSGRGAPLKRALITGGTGSVGRALVAAFAASGYDVVFQYFGDPEAARSLGERVGAQGFRQDFRETLQLRDAAFDILVNNAGINISDGLSDQVTDQEWNETIRVNLTAPFALVRAVLPTMLARRWGRIVNVNSIYGQRGVENNLPYTASKHGLSGITKTIAKEYAPFGITCNEVCPGPLDSDLMRAIAARKEAAGGISVEDYLKEASEEQPLQRLVLPKEVAAAILFLVSEEASATNGVSLTVDGGLIA